MSPSVARSAEAPFQSRALMMRALLPSSSVNQSLTNILMCGVIAWVFGRRCGGNVTCSGFVKAFGFSYPLSPCAPKAGYQATTGVRGITVRGTPSASVGRARGPRDASGYATQTRHPTPHDHESIFTSIFIGN